MTLQTLATQLKAQSLMLGTAESCTGGLLAAQCTSLPGSSQWFDRALVTYSNQAKIALLKVPATIIEQHGAVSEACAQAMLKHLLTQVDVGVAITGIAGPDGGTADKPVGTVWFAFGLKQSISFTSLKHFEGDRDSIRQQACQFAIEQLILLSSA